MSQTRTFRSAPNLTQEEALEALQAAPFFTKGAKVVGIRPGSNKQWVAAVKFAGPFPPSDDEGSDDAAPPSDDKPAFADDGAGSDDSGGGDDIPSDDGPPSPDDGGGESKGEKKPKEPKGDEAIIGLLQEILLALQGGAGPEGGMGGPDALANGPSGMSAPPKGHGGPPGGPGGGPPPGPPGGGKPPAGRPMRPGEAPPGSTPVGAPAFASTHTAQLPGQPGIDPAVGTSTPPGAPGVPGAGAGALGTCPECGMPEPCPMHSGAAGAASAGAGAPPLLAQVQSAVGKLPTIVLNADYDPRRKVNEYVKEANDACAPHGYKIRLAKVDAGKIRIVASVR